MNAVIEVKNIIKKYALNKPKNGEKELLAINDVSFSVQKGEIFGILGPNGAGKTSTLGILEGINKQTSGIVAVLGFDNIKQSDEIKKRIGVQLQESGYLPLLTLKELLDLFSSLYSQKGADKNSHRPKNKALLGLVGLEDKANEQVRNLSGGQKQRFTIATSLVNDPEIIFLDEPTTGLDPLARRNLWDLVKQINAQGITIVLTTHYMEEAEYLCNRVAIMDKGKILKIEAPQKLIEDLSHNSQISFLIKNKLDESMFSGIPEIEKIYNKFPKVILEIKTVDTVSKILNILKIQKVEFSSFNLKTASLEDVYLDLTGTEYEE